MTGRLRIFLADDSQESTQEIAPGGSQEEAGGITLTPARVERLRLAIGEESTATLVTIEGQPGSFCAGLSLRESLGSVSHGRGPPSSPASQSPAEEISRFEALLLAIERTARPVVALVDGPALGGGVGIAAASDLVIASPRASFALPETLLGLTPAAVFPVLVRRIGIARSRLLAVGRAPLSAEEALQWGLVDEVADDVEQALARHARRFRHMDLRAVGAVKALAATHFSTPPGYAEDAASRFAALFSSDETRDRLRRWAQGDSPWTDEGAA